MGIGPEREIEISLKNRSSTIIWTDSTGKKRNMVVLPTVYPPREDTTMLHKALSKIKGQPGKMLEIGTGSGAIGTSMSEVGWKVCGIDVNPFAIASARGNHQNSGIFETIEMSVEEIGENFERSWDVIAWNTPYLDSPPTDEDRLGPFEEASLSWEGEHPVRRLLKLASIPGMLSENGCIIALVSTSDDTDYELSKAISEGWSLRIIETRSNGGEKTAVVALWKGWKWEPHYEKSVSSTMEFCTDDMQVGNCIISSEQTGGYGRKSSPWISVNGDLTGTWRITGPEPPNLDIQSIHMAASLAIFNAICSWKGKVFQSTTWVNNSFNDYSIKWPNDIFCSTTNTKVSGILLEAQSKGDELWISCGIGINSTPRIVEGEMKAGVSETGLEGLEKHVHIHLSSWFENHERVPDADKNFLRRRWWNVASNTHIIGKNKTYKNRVCLVSELLHSQLQIYSEVGKTDLSDIEIED
ncbi:MAG: hypothetical protein CMB54_01660 [Euryarchaeota archaeon]|nr:hypothetical protein [Euryarchaeota archaeon]